MIRRGILSNFLILFALLWIGHVHAQNQKIIRVGLFSVPPHIFPSNPPTGSSIEFIKKFAKDNNYQIEWLTEVPFPRLLSLLKMGQIDIAPLISQTKEREDFIHYPKSPMMESKAAIILRADHRLNQINGLDDIRGMNLAYIQGAIIPPFLQQKDAHVTYTFLGSDNWVKIGLDQLSKKWIDGILTLERYTIRYEIKNRGLIDQYKSVDLPDIGEKDFAYLAVSKQSPLATELLDSINNWIKKNPYQTFIEDSLKK